MKLSIVQIIILVVAGFAIVSAVVLFATNKGGLGSAGTSSVVLWGTIPSESFNLIIQELAVGDKSYDGLQYVQKNAATFEDDLLKALAEGSGPDLVILNEKQVLSNQNRMLTIPFKSFPARTFQDLFLDEGNMLVARDGILGFPFTLDPLVMYYNKDILKNTGYARPPETWTEVLAVTPSITVKDSSFNISKSSIALGSFENVRNAKDIFWALTLQAGNPVIERYVDSQTQEEKYRSILNDNLNFTLNPAYAATNFFTQFSNPTKTIYSWNRSLPDSQSMFVAGDLAFYIGYASEFPTIRRINPNLNFDIALLPQSQNSARKITYGSMSVLAIPKTSKNVNGAVAMASVLTSAKAQAVFAKALNVAPVRRDLLSSYDSTSSYESVINRSAIIAQGILEPDARRTSDIIRELITTVVSGQYEITEAIGRAHDKLNTIIND